MTPSRFDLNILVHPLVKTVQNKKWKTTNGAEEENLDWMSPAAVKIPPAWAEVRFRTRQKVIQRDQFGWR